MTAALEVEAAVLPITVNGIEIDGASIARETQHHPSTNSDEAWRSAASALVIRELLLQEARRRRLQVTPEIDERGRRETEDEALIGALVESQVETPTPTSDEIARYYQANRSRFRSPELYEASHILIAARRDDEAAFAAAREKARDVAADLAEFPNNFVGMARVFSNCQSARDGGSLGQVSDGDVTPEFIEALRSLTEGEITREPIETRYGFHIIRLDRHRAGELLPLDAAAGRIAEYLKERSERTAITQFIARLISAAKISGIVLADAESHRVF